jgi:hypothetical protein
MTSKIDILLEKLGKIEDKLAKTHNGGDFVIKENSDLFNKLNKERFKIKDELRYL